MLLLLRREFSPFYALDCMSCRMEFWIPRFPWNENENYSFRQTYRTSRRSGLLTLWYGYSGGGVPNDYCILDFEMNANCVGFGPDSLLLKKQFEKLIIFCENLLQNQNISCSVNRYNSSSMPFQPLQFQLLAIPTYANQLVFFTSRLSNSLWFSRRSKTII